MIRQSILVLVVLLASAVVSVASTSSIDIFFCCVHYPDIPPSSTWTIEPNNPTINDRINFLGYTEVFSNCCHAEMYTGCSASITIDAANKTVELRFGSAAIGCSLEWDPVFGFVRGHFGPLADGDWLFFGDHPYTCNFAIPFRVSSLEVLEPNGNESLLAGAAYTINWTDFRSDGNCPGDYLLDYSTDNGQNWIPVDSNSVSNTCSHDWLVPSINSDQSLIRIIDADDPNVSDTTDAAFTIYECTLKTDLTGDCVVNFLDFAALMDEWLKCGNPFDPNCVQ